jgi:hypothetical protein
MAALATNIHKHIGQAASISNTPAILGLTALLSEVDRLSQKYQHWSPEGTGGCIAPSEELQMPRDQVKAELTPKERGKRIRATWLQHNAPGLARLRETLYRNSRGEIVGIAVATEKAGVQGSQSSWWLGLPKGKFQTAILLCVAKSDGVFSVCLPKVFLDEQKQNLSQSVQGGNVQFTVLSKTGEVYLQVPRVGRVDVRRFVNNVSPLL